MASKPEQLDALDAMIADPMSGPPAVLCRVCQTMIDAETGDPLEPVDERTVDAVRQYTLQSGQNELGGVALDVGM